MKRPAWNERPGAPSPGTRLCALDEIGDPGARGFLFGEGSGRFDMFIVRDGGTVSGFVNECPHQLTPLETWPDKFLTLDGSRIVCSTHGALFRLADGHCTSGPCEGSRLLPVPVVLQEGQVLIGR